MRSTDHLRRDYEGAAMRIEDLDPDPVAQFGAWFDEAEHGDADLPDACTLATASRDGRPDARIVVLRGFDRRGFGFYTCYDSAKARDLETNPQAALVFLWTRPDRQVRIRGPVERMTAEDSAAYFARRPRASQLGAAASPQSDVIESRDELERRVAELAGRHEGASIPAPANWGGYRVVPHEIEFWQGRADRLHDRVLYTRDGDRWTRVRLAP